jgi:hypothetical protein
MIHELPPEGLLFAKPRAFFFHYNKPASQAAGGVRFTVHVNGQCLLAARVECQVPISTRVNSNQPHAVVAGKAHCFTLQNGVATISHTFPAPSHEQADQ